MHEIAPVPADAPVVERGVGFFETVLCLGRRAVLWEGHLARLFGSVTEFDFPVPSRTLIEGEAARRLDAHPSVAGEERSLRVSWIAVGQDLDSPSSWRLDVVLRAIPEATQRRRAGSSAITLPASYRRDSATVKSTSYFAAVVGLRHARRAGGDEGLFQELDGTYLEGTSTGLVCWNGRAPVYSSAPVLPSVTRNAFLRGREQRRPLTRADLRGGALLVGSLTLASPIIALDGEGCALPEEMLAEVAEFKGRLATDPQLGTGL